MAAFIVEKLVKLLINADQPVKGARIGIMGLTFKENVSDLRNSRVPDIVHELGQYGISPLVHDPLGDPAQALHEYGIEIQPLDTLAALDALILAVPHGAYLAGGLAPIFARIKPGGILIDVKSAITPADIPATIRHWSL
jgi:UDP-N-acetyl-D-galactosamine dehydrogenase